MEIAAFAHLWKELRGFIEPTEIADASEVLVNILIENDFEHEEIMVAFKRDPDVLEALKEFYDGVEEDEEDWEDEEDSYEDDY